MSRYRILFFAGAALSATLWAYACGDGATEPAAPPPDSPRPTTVTVAPATPRLTALGATVQLTAEVLDQNGRAMAGAGVTWTSSNALVVTVSGSGLVTAAANGTATITATAARVSGIATVTVSQEVSAVAVSPAADTLLTGDTLRLAAEATDANGHVVAVAEFSWASSDTLVAVVDDAGLVTGVGAGQAAVTAAATAITGSTHLTIVAPSPTTIAVTPDTVALTALGQTVQLTAEVRDQAGRAMVGVPVSWSSADTTVAAVDSAGRVTAAGRGATTIAAGAERASGESLVKVMQSAGSVTVSPTADTVALGDTLRLVAEALDENGHRIEDAAFTWSSGDLSVARVDASGLVTGVAEGTATITASAGTAQGTAEITVANPDRGALVALYDATDGPNWAANDNWLTDASLGDWYGVRTDGNGRVTGLSLRGNNLNGWIPAALSLLDALRVLDLSNNSLHGPLPPQLGRLKHLQDLLLSENDLSGPLPPEIVEMTSLRSLWVSRTKLSGPVPESFVQLNLLQFFFHDSGLCLPPSLLSWVGGIEHTDDPIACIPATSDRDVLVALYTATGGPGWKRRVRWSSDAQINTWAGVKTNEDGYVTELLLPDNGLAGALLPELGDLAQIERLLLSGNELTGELPAELGQLTELRHLSLADNELVGSIPPALGGLPALRILDLDGNELEGAIPATLGRLASLEQLNLSRNLLTGMVPAELGNLANLEHLSLFENQLGGAIPSELGKLRKLDHLRLADNRLTGAIPPELGNLSALREIHIGRNRLTGPIPPQLGALRSLTFLALFVNNLSGPLPPELGDLNDLEVLWLSGNPGLRGLLPRTLLDMESLSNLDISSTGLCAQIDAEFQDWLRGIEADFEDCDAGHVERLALAEFFTRMDGSSWTRRNGWNTGMDVNAWHGVTARGGRVRVLALADNGLAGPLPAETANLTALEALDLGGNRLSGELPAALASMTALASMRFSGNGDMAGALPFRLTELTRLERLEYEDTGLCASPAATFQEWLGGIDVVVGATCGNPGTVGLSLPVVYLTQAIQRPAGDVPLISGRDALLRVFLVSSESAAFFEPEVVATFTRDGREVHRVVMERAEDRLATVADESNLRNSYNAVIPAEHIRPDVALVVEADPGGVVPLAAGSQIRFPVSGGMPLNVIEVPPMELTVVPVLEADEPDPSIFEWTDNIGDDSPEVGLLRHAFPFSEFSARSREAYYTSLDLTSDDGQWLLVLEMEALRALDGGTGYYYGAAASVNGDVRGRARLAAWASIGRPWDKELAHEVGHNLDLLHAPCGGAAGPDPEFPYPNGGLGAWGYDFREGSVVSAERRRDIMGYCYERGWLSDHYFEKVIEYRERVEDDRARARIAAARPSAEMLVLWGGVVNGQLRLEPPFRATVAPRLPAGTGPYHIEGLGSGGDSEFSLAFAPGEDKFGDKYFFFAIPIEDGWPRALERVTLTGPEGEATIDADAERAISVVTDRATGRVRAILRDLNSPLPAALGRAGDLEVATFRSIADALRTRR